MSQEHSCQIENVYTNNWFSIFPITCGPVWVQGLRIGLTLILAGHKRQLSGHNTCESNQNPSISMAKYPILTGLLILVLA